MKKKIALLLCVLCICFPVGCSNSGENDKTKSNDTGNVPTDSREIFAMDTYMTLTAWGEKASSALDEAEREITRLENLLSAEISDSEVYTVNKNGSVILSEDTADIVEASIELYHSTQGAFDITIYPLMKAWGFTSGNYQVPQKKQIQSLVKKVDTSKMEYDKEERFLSLPEGVEIDLGGIAKGYTSARIMEIFQEYNLVSGMVSLGGNVQVYRKKTDGTPFKIAVESPDDQGEYVGVLQIENKAVITSGGYERYFEKNGKKWHHILNPETGYPAQSGLTSVTIVSQDGTKADVLSTALFVMGKEKAIQYWRKHYQEFDVILVDEEGSVTVTQGLEKVFSSDREVRIVSR